MNSIEALEKEIDYLEIRKQTAYRNEYYSVYQECEERINNLKKIKQDLEHLKQLEEENQDLKNRLANEQLAFDKLFESNQKLSELYAKLKKTIDILKDRKNILKYNGLKGTYELGWLTQEEYELLKEVLGNE